VAPRLMHEMCVAAMAGQVHSAVAIHMKLLGLHKQLFCEPSPAPTKWALAQMGRCKDSLRLPLLPLTPAGQAAVGAAMREAGLL
jgi:4-hydroxy-tetrahydrodipicolinate synthase